MGEKLVGDGFTARAQLVDGAPEIDGVPEDDRGDCEIEAGSAVALIFECAVADFAETMEENGSGERVARLAFVEREMIRERTRAGLREAIAKGNGPGRKPKITAEQRKEIVEAVSSGRKTAAEIARLFKIHRATVSRFVSQNRAAKKPASKP